MKDRRSLCAWSVQLTGAFKEKNLELRHPDFRYHTENVLSLYRTKRLCLQGAFNRAQNKTWVWQYRLKRVTKSKKKVELVRYGNSLFLESV